GGYVIAPPSRHPRGGIYRWRGPLVLPQLPLHLLDRLRAPQATPLRPCEPVRIDRALSAWAARALDDEAHQVSTAAPGGRNHRPSLPAFSLGQIAASGLLDPDLITDHLHRAALQAGLGSRESTLTIRSGLRAGMRTPRLPRNRTDRPSPEVEASIDLSP